MVKQKITGIMIYYYFVCKRKLWLNYNNISMESESQYVEIGKFLDENSYNFARKHIMINGEINLDFVEKSGVIHEIKKSRAIEEASIWQVKYYLFYLKKYGLDNIKAKIDYPILKKVIEVELSKTDEEKLEGVIKDILNITQNSYIPDIASKNICNKCAFYDLCMI